MNSTRLALSVLVLLASSPGCRQADEAPPTDASRTLDMTAQSSGTDALLQAVSPVSDEIVWVSGHQATYARTVDGGENWEAVAMAGAEGLQFRDVAAFDDQTAYLMSSGTGDLSRIYRTDDGGASWILQYTATHPEAFLDCMDFWSPDRGLVYGDEVDGVPFLLRTEDGGDSWTRVSTDGLPPALDGEGGFAASGTCLVTGENGRAWVATGAGARARLLSTEDFGATWGVMDPPVVGGPSAGLTTIQIGPDGRGIALGGVIGNDTIRSENVVVTTDAGASWAAGGMLVMAGPVYGSALLGSVAVAVGPRGMDWSSDGGATWQSADTLTYWAAAFSSPHAGWAVGPQGRIVKLSVGGG
jgi:photosystem II stability/assembly factor-like uncharacterized protein